MTKGQIRQHLNRLAGHEACDFGLFEWKCGGRKFEFSRKILDAMNIPKEVQDICLEFCNELGGYCDSETLTNAVSSLLREETP